MTASADELAAAVRRGMILADPRLSRFDPLPRIIAYDDFDRGHCGWSQLVGNYEGSLDTILPGYRELNGPMLSSNQLSSFIRCIRLVLIWVSRLSLVASMRMGSSWIVTQQSGYMSQQSQLGKHSRMKRAGLPPSNEAMRSSSKRTTILFCTAVPMRTARN